MRNSVASILFLTTICLCSCGDGGGTPDCSSTSTVVQTGTGKVVASATVAVAPADGQSYSILGTNLDNVAGIQLDITYDEASLTSPTVTQGSLVSGAMFVANTTTPGVIRIAIISTHPFASSGEIAKVSFASRAGNGGITSITTSMINSSGSPVDAPPNNSATDSSPPPTTDSLPQQSATSAPTTTACR